jgi:transcriptional regulator with XRE-family HTH domain
MRAAAKLGGVSATAWSDVEAGKSPPSLATQRAVATALRWPTDWLDQVARGDVPVSQPADDRTAELRLQVAELVETVVDLARQVQAQGDELARLARRSDPPAPATAGGPP